MTTDTVRLCDTCHSEITEPQNKRFCSWDCRTSFRAPPRPCPICGQPITGRDQSLKRQRTCSRQCSSKWKTMNLLALDVLEMYSGEWFSARAIAAHIPNRSLATVKQQLHRLRQAGLVESRSRSFPTEDSMGRWGKWHVESEYRAL